MLIPGRPLGRIFFPAVLAFFALASMAAPSSAAPITYSTLTVVDGWNADQGATLSAIGWVTALNTDNDSQNKIRKGTNFSDATFVGVYFQNATIPADQAVVEAALELETNVQANSNKSATLYIDFSDARATTLWSDAQMGNETAQGLNTSTIAMTGTGSNFVYRSLNVSGVYATEAQINNAEIVFRNDTNSMKNIFVDFVRFVIGYRDEVPPAAVTDVFASSTTNPTEIEVFWSAPGDNGNALDLVAGSEYYIQHASSFDGPWSTASAQVVISTSGVAPGTPQRRTLGAADGIAANTTFYVSVWTIDEDGNLSGRSNAGDAVTLANPPSGTQVYQANPSSATVNWNALPASPQSESSEGYRLEASTASDFSGTVFASATPNVALSTLTVAGLAVNATYYFRAASLNWESVPNFAAAVSSPTRANPPETADPVYLSIQQNALRAQWSAAGNPQGTGFRAEIAGNPDFSPLAASSETLATDALFSGLALNTTYYLRVRAESHGGFPTDWLSLGSTATLAAAPVAAAVPFTAVSVSSLAFDWGENGNPGGTRYEAEIAGNPSFSPLHASSNTANTDILWGTGGAGAALSPDTTYYARVRALNHNAVPTAYLATASTATHAEPIAAPAFGGVFTASATVSWTAPASGTEGFRLEAAAAADFSGTVFSSATQNGALTTLVTDPGAGLAPNTTYYFRVANLNHNSVLTYAPAGSTSTLANRPVSPGVPDAPDAVGKTSATVSWTLPAGTVVGFELQASEAADFTAQIISSITPVSGTTELTVEGLSSDTTYYFRVGSINHNSVRHFESAGSTKTLVSTDFFPPDPIEDLAASTFTATQMRLNWLAPEDPSDNPLNGNYRIQYATSETVTWSTANAQVALSTSGVVPDEGQERIVGGLDPNTTYYFRAWTSDLKPNWSEVSNIASTVTLARALQNPAVLAVFEASATVGWARLPDSPEFESAIAYRLELSTASDFSGTVRSSQTPVLALSTLTVAGLMPNTTYYARAGALNRLAAPNYAVLGATATKTRAVGPAAAPFLQVFIGSATAAWAAFPDSPPAASSESSRGYLLQASTAADFSGVVLGSATPAVALSTLTVFGLAPNATYYFRAGGLNWNGAARFVHLGATSTLANPPVSRVFESLHPSSAVVSYAAGAGGAFGFRVDASTAADFTGTRHSSETLSAAQLILAVLSPPLDANTTYYFRFGAFNANKNAHFAAAEATATLANAPNAVAPSFLEVWTDSATVQWEALPASPQTETGEGYLLQASTAPDFTGVVRASATVVNAVSSLAVSGLDGATTYYFRVGSLNWPGAPNFTVLGATAALPETPAAAPPEITAVFISSARAQWDANGNGQGAVYDLEGSTASDFSGAVAAASGPATALWIEGLTGNATYYLRVRARNPNGLSSAYHALGGTTTLPADPLGADPPYDPVFLTSMTAHWTVAFAGNAPDTDYELHISSTAGFEAGTIVSSVTKNLLAEAVGLIPDTTYYARARALGRHGLDSPFLQFASTATRAAAPGPGDPANFSGVGSDALTLHWTSGTVAGEFNPIGTSSGTLYEAELSTAADFSETLGERFTRALSASYIGLLPGSTYYARVRAINRRGLASAFADFGSTVTLPSSLPVFVSGTFEYAADGLIYLAPGVYTDTTTVTARARVQSNSPPGLAVSTATHLLGLWRFEEAAGPQRASGARGPTDSFVHYEDQTGACAVAGCGPGGTAGRVGRGLKLDGVDDYLIADGLYPWRASAANNNWTVELWFKAGSSEDRGYIFSLSDFDGEGGAHDADLTWENASGNLQFGLATGGKSKPNVWAVAPAAYDDGQWHHFAGVLDAASLRVHVDGALVASNANATSANANTWPIAAQHFTFIGAAPKLKKGTGNAQRFYAGAVDEVRIASIAYSAAQVQRHFEYGRAGLDAGSAQAAISTKTAADGTWTRLSTNTLSITGTAGTLAAQTFTISSAALRETASPGAATNRLTFLAADLHGRVATGQFTVLVDTTPPTNIGVASLTNATTGSLRADALAAADALAGLHAAPYDFDASTAADFTGDRSSSGFIADGFFTLPALLANTTYYARVRARDAAGTAGNASAYSPSLATATLANLPQAVEAFTVYPGSVSVRWDPFPPSPQEAAAEGFALHASSLADFSGTVVSSETAVGTVSTLTARAPPLAPNTTYYFRLGSRNWHGASNYAPDFSTVTLAELPVAVALFGVEPGSITLSWDAPGSGSSGYRLDASTAADFSGTLISSETPNGALTKLTAFGLAPNTTYYLRAGSLNHLRAPNFETPLATSTLAETPRSAALFAVGITSAALEWDAPASGAEGYRLDASTAADFSGTLVTSSTFDAAVTTLTVAGLVPNTTYYLRAGAFNHAGRLNFAVPLTTPTRASPPAARTPAFAEVAITSATAQWNNGSPANPAGTVYVLEASTAADFTGADVSSTAAAAFEAPLTGLALNTTYYWRVFARGHAGLFSEPLVYGATVTRANEPAAPAYLTIHPSSVAVQWSLPAGGASGFRLDAALDAGFTSGVTSSITYAGGAASLTVEGLEADTTYYFRAGSLNHAAVPTYAALAATSTLANPVLNLDYFEIAAVSAALRWDRPAGNGRGYRLEAALDGSFSPVAASSRAFSLAATTLTVSGLAPNTTYFYRVGTVNANDVPNHSVLGATSTRANAPVSPVVDAVADSSATLAWGEPSGGAAGFIVEASTAANFSGAVVLSSAVDPAVRGLSVSGLSPATTYYLRAGALNWNSVAAYAAALSTFTRAAPPDSFAFTAVDLTSATLQWSAAEGAESGYRLEASTASDFSGTVLSSTTDKQDDLDLTVLSLGRNTTHYFRVGALGRDGDATYSTVLATSTLSQEVALQPRDIVAVYAGSVTAHWVALPPPPPLDPSAEGYRLRASTAADFSGTVLSSATPEVALSTLTAPTLSPNATYYFRVASLNHNGVPGPERVLAATSTLANLPVSPVFAAVLESSASVSWAAPAGGAQGFRVDASTAADFTGDLFVSTTASGVANSLVVQGLASNTTFYFRAGSLNHNGAVHFAVSAATPTLAERAVAPAAEEVHHSSLTAAWALPTGAVSAFELHASTASDFTGATSSSRSATGGETTLAALGLDANTTYYLRVGSLNRAGAVQFAFAAATATRANPPVSPSTTSVQITSMSVSWSAPAFGAEGYALEASPNADFSPPLLSSRTPNGTLTELAVGGLDPNTTYYLRVGALNHNGVADYAAAGSTSSRANAPTGLAFDAVGVASFTVSWTASAGGAEGYRLDASAAADFATLAASSETANSALTTLAVEGLASDTTYYLRVVAFDHNGAPTHSATAARSTLANAPVSPAVDAAFVSSVTVSWTIPAGGREGFVVDASTASDFTGTINSSRTPNGDLALLTVQALLSDTTYYLRVGTLNHEEVPHFALVPATKTLIDIDESGPAAITDLAASTETAVSVMLTWSAPEDPTNDPLDGSYALQASTEPVAVVYSTTNAQVLFSTVGVVAGSLETRSFPGLLPNTTYYFRAFTADTRPNWSPLSNGATVATLAKPPAGVGFEGVRETSATLSWGAFALAPSSESANAFELSASAAADFGGTVFSSRTTHVTLSTLTVAGLARNTTYYWRVASVNRNELPNTVVFEATATLTALIERLDDDVLAADTASVTLQWAALPGAPPAATAEGYRARLSTAADFSGTVFSSATADAAVSTLTLAGLAPNTTYYARAGGLNWNGVPNEIALAATSTLANPPDGPAFAAVERSSGALSWSAPAGGARGYRFDASTAADFTGALASSETASGAETSLYNLGLDANTTYYFRVGSLNHRRALNFAAALATSTLANPPDAPLIDAMHLSSAALAWTAPAFGAEAYRVDASTAADFSGTLSSSRSATGGEFALAASGLDLNTTYYFRVAAFNHNDAATFAVVGASATRAAVPAAVAEAFSNVHITSLTAAYAANGNPTGTDYEVDLSTASDFSGTLFEAGTEALSAGLSGLAPNTTYYGRVRARNYNGVPSSTLALGSTITRASTPGLSTSVFDPVFVTSLTATWSPGVPANPDGTRYDARLSSSSNFTGLVHSSDTAGLAATFAALEANTTYYLKIRARNGTGLFSPFTAVVSTPMRAADPGPNVGVTTYTGVGFEAFTLNHASGPVAGPFNPDDTRYKAQVSRQSDFSTIDAEAIAEGPSKFFGGLVSGTTYYARVRAISRSGFGTDYIAYGSTVTLPSSIPSFVGGSFEYAGADGAFLAAGVYTDTTTPKARVRVQSTSSPGLSVSTTPVLLFHWPFEEGSGTTAADASRTANDGTLTGGPARISGRLGSGLDLDGVDDYVVSGDLPGWRKDAANNAFTVTLWFRTTTNAGLLFQVSDSDTEGTATKLDATIGFNNSGNLAFVLRRESDGAARRAEASASFADGNWRLLAATLGSDGMKLYVDGALKASNADIAPGAARLYPGAVHAWVGSGSSGESQMGNGTKFADADIDEVLVATAAFSAARVADDYAQAGSEERRFGTPAVDISTEAGANASWARVSTGVWSITGSAGSMNEETFALAAASLRETAAPGADTNIVLFTASDLAANQATAQFTILVDTTPPPAPTFQSLAVPSSTTLSVEGLAGSDPLSGLAALPFRVETSTAADFSGTIIQGAFVEGPDAALGGLDPNTTYYARAAARDAAGAGNLSGFSASQSTPTLAPPPGLLAETYLSVGLSSVTAAWAAVEASDGYALRASTAPDFSGTIFSSRTAVVTLSTLTIASLGPDTTYYFRVGSLNHAGRLTFTALGSTRTVAEEIGVVISTPLIDMGLVLLNQEVLVTTSNRVTSVGNVAQTYSIHASTVSAGSPWTISTSSGLDAFTLQTLFNSIEPAAGDLGENDKLLDSDRRCDGVRFVGDQDCANVEPSGERLLWLRLGMPTLSSTEAQQDIHITITAEPP